MDSPLDFTPHMNFWELLAIQNVGSFKGVIYANYTSQNVEFALNGSMVVPQWNGDYGK